MWGEVESQNAIRLLEGTRFSIHELELPETVPANLAEALKYEEAENEVSCYSSSSGALVGKGGRKAAIFYDQGVGHDDSKDHLLDEAATQTILHGGSVYAVEQAKVPGESMLAAVFRY